MKIFRQYLLDLWPLLVGFSLLRLLCFTGPAGTDDARYLTLARELTTHWSLATNDHAATRLEFMLILGLPYQLGGLKGVIASILMLATLLDVVVSFECYRRWGKGVAILCAAWMGFNKLSATYPSMVFPDVYLALICYLFVKVYPVGQLPSGQERIRAVVSGVLIGAAMSFKESGIFLIPPVLLFALLWQRRVSLFCWLLLGLCLHVLIVDVLGYYLLTGDPLFRVHLASGSALQAIRWKQEVAGGGLNYWFLQLRQVTRFSNGAFWVTMGTVALFSVYLAYGKDKLIALVGLFFWGYSLFGTSTLHEYLPLPLQERYLYPLLPLSTLCLGELCSRLRPAAFSGVAALICLACLGGSAAAVLSGGSVYRSQVVRQVTLALRLTAASPVPVSLHLDEDLYKAVVPYLDSQARGRLQPHHPGDGLPAGTLLLTQGSNPPREPLQGELVLEIGDLRNVSCTMPLLTREGHLPMRLYRIR